MRVKNSTKDLHKAAKALKRVVARKLKLKKAQPVRFEHNHSKRRCFIRYTFTGDPLQLKSTLKEYGFRCEVKVIAEEKVVRVTKMFVYAGLIHIARLSIIPSMQRLTLSISVEQPVAFLH